MLAPPPPDSPATALELAGADRATLDSARAWARFQAIVTSVLLGLSGLVIVGVVTFAPGLGTPVRWALGLASAVGLGVAAYWTSLLWRFVRGAAAFRQGRVDGLVGACNALRLFWLFGAVAGVVSAVLSAGLLLATLLGVYPPSKR